MRRLDLLGAEAAEIAVAHVVGVDDDDVGVFFACGWPGFSWAARAGATVVLIVSAKKSDSRRGMVATPRPGWMLTVTNTCPAYCRHVMATWELGDCEPLSGLWLKRVQQTKPVFLCGGRAQVAEKKQGPKGGTHSRPGDTIPGVARPKSKAARRKAARMRMENGRAVSAKTMARVGRHVPGDAKVAWPKRRAECAEAQK